MPEQQLDAPHVGAGLQKVGGKGVTQRMRRDRLGDAAGALRLLARLAHGIAGDGPLRDVPREQPGPGCPTLQYERRSASRRGESMT